MRSIRSAATGPGCHRWLTRSGRATSSVPGTAASGSMATSAADTPGNGSLRDWWRTARFPSSCPAACSSNPAPTSRCSVASPPTSRSRWPKTRESPLVSFTLRRVARPHVTGWRGASLGQRGLDRVEAAHHAVGERADLADVDPDDVVVLQAERGGGYEAGSGGQDHAVRVDVGVQEPARQLVVGTVQLAGAGRAGPGHVAGAQDGELDREG